MWDPRSRRLRPDYGRGMWELPDEEVHDADFVLRRVHAVFATPGFRPPLLPTVGRALLELARDLEAPAARLLSVAEADPFLAAHVLRYACAQQSMTEVPVRSLREALSRLGPDAIRDMLLDASVNLRLFQAPGYAEAMDRLVRHSVATARVSRLVARYTSFDPECAYLCGLLHDVGFAAGLIAFADVPRGERRPELEPLWPVLEDVHERVGTAVLHQLHLPPDVTMAVELHHAITVGGIAHPLAAVVCAAESIAFQLGAPGVLPPAPPIHAVTADELEACPAVGPPQAGPIAGPRFARTSTPLSWLRPSGFARAESPARRSLAIARSVLGLDDRTFEAIRTSARAVLAVIASKPAGTPAPPPLRVASGQRW